MYDRTWARGVLERYLKSCPRAGHCRDLLLTYRARHTFYERLSPALIASALTSSIQGYDRGRLWRAYKRAAVSGEGHEALIPMLYDITRTTEAVVAQYVLDFAGRDPEDCEICPVLDT